MIIALYFDNYGNFYIKDQFYRSLNYNDVYYLHHRQVEFGKGSSTMTIAKFSDFLSDEGNQWAMSKGSYIETDNGITQITISK